MGRSWDNCDEFICQVFNYSCKLQWSFKSFLHSTQRGITRWSFDQMSKLNQDDQWNYKMMKVSKILENGPRDPVLFSFLQRRKQRKLVLLQIFSLTWWRLVNRPVCLCFDGTRPVGNPETTTRDSWTDHEDRVTGCGPQRTLLGGTRTATSRR